jgi:hypothetical protein
MALDLPSSPLFGAALAHELETSAIAQIMQISDGMLIARSCAKGGRRRPGEPLGTGASGGQC